MPIDVIDVADLIRRRKRALAMHAVPLAREYGQEIVSGLRRPTPRSIQRHGTRLGREFFFLTSFMAERMRQEVLAELAGRDYLFTIQTQSLFDGSTGRFPHFVYSHMTALTKRASGGYGYRENNYSRQHLQMEHRLYHNSEMVFTMSTIMAESLIKDYDLPPEKVACVYSGANASYDAHGPARPRSSKEILFVGVDWEIKGGPTLVAAFQKVLEAVPDASLKIIGCSPSIKAPRCQVLGRRPLEELPRQYQTASVFCLPSKVEAAGPCVDRSGRPRPSRRCDDGRRNNRSSVERRNRFARTAR